MEWEPIFTDNQEKASILDMLNLIKYELLNHTDLSDVSLLGGITGISIYWEYLSKLENNKAYKELSVSLLNSALSAISNVPLNYTFSTGIAGIAWTYSHLYDTEIQQGNGNTVIGSEIKSFLRNCSKEDIAKGNLDYLHGGTGPLIYFINCHEIETKNFLEKIIKTLSYENEKSEDTVPWIDWLEFNETGNRRYNLGLSHGIPSIIIIIARLLSKGICIYETQKLLYRSIKWMLDHKNDPGESISIFPAFIEESGIEKNNRLAWCYGDLGIAIVLLQCAELTNNIQWKNEAINIALHSSRRKEHDLTYVEEVPFCHGSIGIGHIFNRLYQQTGMVEFKEASRFWFIESINYFKNFGHLKTIQTDHDGTNKRWEQHSGILDGYSGIGLSLISSISNIEPKWDRCLLLS